MTGFDVRALERGYAFLDDVPLALFEDLVAHPVGTLEDRVAGVLHLRGALLRGEVRLAGWPPEPHRSAVASWLEASGLARFTRDQPELADAFLHDLLRLTAEAAEWEEGRARALLAELAERERAERREASPGAPRVDTSTRERLLASATGAARGEGAEEVAAALGAGWAERIRLWTELSAVFGELGDVLGLGWDLSRGALQRTGWLEVERLRHLLARAPALRDLVRQLGRLRTPEADAPAVTETVLVGVRRVEEELREMHTPLAPTETRGVERSGSIARMLPVEAALLTHPTLRLLWHARRAERALLTYRVEGVLSDRVSVETEGQQEQQRRVPRPERGPVLVCLDTSGSMSGAPELVAKAVTLEAMRVAHEEKRACHLYTFGGPGEVAEHTLDLSPRGVDGLLSFLTMSFRGGTDVAEPMRRALERLAAGTWRRADVLVVSDGEFPVDDRVVAEVEAARTRLETRFHGLLVGGGARAMARLCDRVHHFLDWNALSDGRAG